MRLAATSLAAAILLGLSGCEQPPPLPKTGDIDTELQQNLAQTRDAAAQTIETVESKNQEVKERLVPMSGQDAGADSAN